LFFCLKKRKGNENMLKHRNVLIAALVVFLAVLSFCTNFATKEAKAVEIITHWVPHEVYGMPGDPDNSGKVFFSGLYAKYMGYPKGAPPYPGKYSRFWRTLPAYRYYIPDYMYNRDEVRPSNPTPGIVRDYNKSAHAKAEPSPTGCDTCHGNNHQKLLMPSSKACGVSDCHEEQYTQNGQGGIGSHASCSSFAQVECAWSIERPPGDTAGCTFCHTSSEERCSTCHQRHQFDPAVARHSEQCKACHWGKESGKQMESTRV
jgi:hydroxylamine dehydrogenase